MTFQVNGRAVDYVESGSGPCIVFVPGSFSSTAAWRPISDQFKDRFRVVATSMPGCGGTEEVRTSENTSAELAAELAEAVVDRTGAAVHLVGHSYGGVVATAVALRKRVPLASLTLVEVNMCDPLRQSGEFGLYNAAKNMSDNYSQAYRDGEPEAARRVIDFWTGEGTFASLPAKMREYAVQTTSANILDWPAMFAFRHPLSDYARIDIPVLLIHGDRSHPSLHKIADLLLATLPVAKREKISGASHLLIGTHPQEIAGLISAHVLAAQG